MVTFRVGLFKVIRVHWAGVVGGYVWGIAVGAERRSGLGFRACVCGVRLRTLHAPVWSVAVRLGVAKPLAFVALERARWDALGLNDEAETAHGFKGVN